MFEVCPGTLRRRATPENLPGDEDSSGESFERGHLLGCIGKQALPTRVTAECAVALASQLRVVTPIRV